MDGDLVGSDVFWCVPVINSTRVGESRKKNRIEKRAWSMIENLEEIL